jgi:hypothetical protein
MTGIRGYGYFISGQRLIESRPASAGLEFRVRAKQFVSAGGTEINSFFVIVPILILVRRLCFRFAQDLKLAGSQDLSPLDVTECYLLCHRRGLDLPTDSTGLCVFRHAEVDGQNTDQKQEQKFHSLAALKHWPLA